MFATGPQTFEIFIQLEALDSRFSFPWHVQVPWLTYVTYASLYFSWKNMAIAKRAMDGGASLAQEPTGSGGGLTTEAVNGAETAFLVSYVGSRLAKLST